MNKPAVHSWGKFLDIVKTIGFFAGLSLALYAFIVRENPPWYVMLIALLLFLLLCIYCWAHGMRSEIKEIITESNKLHQQINDLNDRLGSQISMRTKAEKANVLWSVRREAVVQDIQLLTQLGMVKSRNEDHDRHIAETSGKLIRRLFENDQEGN